MSGVTDAGLMLRGLAVATMFRGEPTQLLQWCNFHLNAGVDGLYVVLDEPSAELVATVPEDPRLHWQVIDAATWDRFYAPSSGNVERKQVDAVRWLARRAEGDGHRHLAFIDSDELLDLAVPFAEVARSEPEATALRFPVREMWFDREDRIWEPFGATLAMRPATRGVDWRATFGWRAQYLRNGVLGHDVGKTVYRLPLASGAFSVHGPLSGRLSAGARLVPEDAGRVLHFDCGSVATWNAKWSARVGGVVVAGGMGAHRRGQMRLFARELARSPQQQERFFAEFFTLDPASVTALESQGLIEHVELSAMLERPLAVPEPSRSLEQRSVTTRRTDYQFAMVCDQNFVKPTFATLISVLAQIDPARSVRFVILGDGLRPADGQVFRSLEHLGYDVEVLVEDVTGDLDRDLGDEGHKRSRATYGRVYLVDLLPEQRTVYLDGDVLATRDISELFDLNLGDACIAGVPDSAALRAAADPEGVGVEQRMRLTGVAGADVRDYINAGVLVLDLDHPDFRRLALESRAYVAMSGRALAQHDQDAINLAFRGRKHRLPSTYNYMTQFYTSERALERDLIALKYAAADASLIHFSGKVKPWLSSEDEFYNGLYRRIVSAAEKKLGVSCGFYFSQPESSARRWSAAQWSERLGTTPSVGTPVISPHTVDVELVDVTDSAVYVRLTAEAYEHAVARGLRLLARTREAVLFDVPLDRFGPQLAHLSVRVMPGVRTASVDLVSALADHGGLARHVEFVLTAPGETCYERSLGMVDVLAAGPAASPALLAEIGIEGGVEGLEGGWLTGRYRTTAETPVCLHIAGELVARRLPRAEDDGTRVLRFRAAHLVGRGYGAAGGELVVTVAGTNVPLPGVVTVEEVRAERAKPQPVVEETRPGVLGRVRRRLRRSSAR